MPGIPRPEELRERLTFKNTGTAYSATGTATAGTTVATLWGRIEETGDGGVENNDQQHQMIRKNYDIAIRYNTDITGYLQIAWGAKTLTITSGPTMVTDRNNRRWMFLAAQEVIERSL